MPCLWDIAVYKSSPYNASSTSSTMMCARTAILGALLNVRINLTSIKDEAFVNAMRDEADTIEAHTILQEQALLDYAKTIL